MSRGEVGSVCRVQEDAFCTASVWVWRLAPIALTVLGVVGNIFNIVILLRRNLRSKPCFILVFLSVSDLLVVISVFMLDCLRKGYKVQLPDNLCLLGHFIKYGFGTFSLWTVAIFTIERLSFVVFPHQSNKHLTQSKTLVALFGILFMVSTIFGLMFFTPSTINKRRINDVGEGNQVMLTNLSTTQMLPVGNHTHNIVNLTNTTGLAEINGATTVTVRHDIMAESSLGLEQPIDTITKDTITEMGLNLHGLQIEHGGAKNGNKTIEISKPTLLNEISGQNITVGDEKHDDRPPGNVSNDKPVVENTSLLEKHIETAKTPRREIPMHITNGPPVVDKISFTNMENCWSYKFEEGSFQHMLRAACLLSSMLIPGMIIILGNTGLVYSLYKRKAHSDSNESQTTTLFAISGVLMTTMIPFGVIVLHGIIFKDETDLTSSYMALIASIAECFTMLNFTLNFYCYFWKSTLFKEECKAMWREIRMVVCKVW